MVGEAEDFENEIALLIRTRLKLSVYCEDKLSFWRENDVTCIAPGVRLSATASYSNMTIDYSSSLPSPIAELRTDVSNACVHIGIRNPEGDVVKYRIYDHRSAAQIPKNARIVSAKSLVDKL